ncbi:MAG TPA: WGR domain-containing protein [Verrucomicrobiae bacterium]|nr:WGR domain-containing protein [Verrucomicrobiae bacterium]
MKPKPQTATAELPSASLFYREGRSDKVYHADVKLSNGGYIVVVAWGRRGSTLQSGIKTNGPVSLETATEIFDAIVASKRRKGYADIGGKPSLTVVPKSQSLGASPLRPRVMGEDPQTSARTAGVLPQLLNELPEHDLELFVKRAGNNWGGQEKYDGVNMTLEKFEYAVHASNKHGQPSDMSLAIANHAASIPGTFRIMGESLGDRFAAHNVVEVDGTDCTEATYLSRWEILLDMITEGPIFVAPLVIGTDAILKLYRRLKAAGAEGMVLKDLFAPHTEGKPNSGGTQLKVKFWADASCIVGAINTKRSVALRLGDVWMGNVTIPPNKRIPTIGAIVDVRYLYAYKDGSLYQPIYRGERTDVRPSECTIEKQRIKFKSAPRI